MSRSGESQRPGERLEDAIEQVGALESDHPMEQIDEDGESIDLRRWVCYGGRRPARRCRGMAL